MFVVLPLRLPSAYESSEMPHPVEKGTFTVARERPIVPDGLELSRTAYTVRGIEQTSTWRRQRLASPATTKNSLRKTNERSAEHPEPDTESQRKSSRVAPAFAPYVVVAGSLVKMIFER
ncbi:hypothetical protein A5N83_01255 [Rhodococcus sp. 1139]|nr:hypothetical protein A5N83_01255 [Rhodococcus sp. 1139]